MLAIKCENEADRPRILVSDRKTVDPEVKQTAEEVVATKRQQRGEHDNEKKATTEQLKRSEAVALKSPRRGPREILA